MPRAIPRFMGTLTWTLALAAFLTSVPFGVDAQPSYPHEDDLIEIMFIPDARVRMHAERPTDLGTESMTGVEAALAPLAWHEWQRACPVPEERLDAMHTDGERLSGHPVYNLNNIYRLRIPAGSDISALSRTLEALPGIMLARPVPKPQPLPVPNYEPNQGYLLPANATPTGLDANYAWGLLGGDGSGVTICDLEYSWNANHDDISKLAGSQINFNYADPFANDNHGTAVVGVMVADNNGWGIRGASDGANLLTCATYYGWPTPQWNLPGAIALAASNLAAGDVMVIEHQWDYTGSGGFVPIEWWTDSSPGPQSFNAVYAAIVNAIANGIIVVEAGGNGGIDTGLMSWIGDSGAIIVGAGGVYTGGGWPNGDLQRLSFSSYGPRFDVQGWGEDVYTTGYGTLYSAEGVNRWYTATFDGTSSATPTVAAAAASCVGFWTANVSPTPPSPFFVRQLLRSTGTPQITPPFGNIGPRPDLQAAIAAMPSSSPWSDVTPAILAGVTNSKGVAWGDYDGDGDDDLYVTRTWQSNKLLRNDAGTFYDVAQVTLNDAGPGAGCAWGDADGDHDLDLYFTNFSVPNKLLRYDGSDVFTDVTAIPLDDNGHGTSTTWVDFDVDGDMDLYCANYNAQPNRLFENVGSGVFIDITVGPLANPTNCLTSAWGDFDIDGDQDVYVVNYNNQPNELLRNDGAGAFVDVVLPPFDSPFNGTSGAWGDYDNDGDLDLYVVNYTSVPNELFRNDGGGVFAMVGGAADLGSGEGAAWGDYDNDGDLDLYVGNNPGANRLFRNDGASLFADVTSGPLSDAGNTQGIGWADYDGDGDLDLAWSNYAGADKLVRNDITNGNHWLHVNLVGSFSNTFGVGARIRVVAGALVQVREVGTGAGYCGQNSLTAEFGLGTQLVVDSVQVFWPSGGRQDSLWVGIDQTITINEPTVIGVGDAPLTPAVVLHPAVPNPCSPATVIHFDLPQPARASLHVFDTAGRLVRNLKPAGVEEAGPHRVRWDGRNDAGQIVPSGVYFYRLSAGSVQRTQRVLVMR